LPLLDNLAALLHIDRYWLKSLADDPQNQPGYTNKAFQWLILEFILSHHDEEFMTCPVACLCRLPNMTTINQSLSQIVWLEMYDDVPMGEV